MTQQILFVVIVMVIAMMMMMMMIGDFCNIDKTLLTQSLQKQHQEHHNLRRLNNNNRRLVLNNQYTSMNVTQGSLDFNNNNSFISNGTNIPLLMLQKWINETKTTTPFNSTTTDQQQQQQQQQSNNNNSNNDHHYLTILLTIACIPFVIILVMNYTKIILFGRRYILSICCKHEHYDHQQHVVLSMLRQNNNNNTTTTNSVQARELDMGPICKYAGLIGMYIDERVLVLKEALKSRTFVYDSSLSLSEQKDIIWKNNNSVVPIVCSSSQVMNEGGGLAGVDHQNQQHQLQSQTETPSQSQPPENCSCNKDCLNDDKNNSDVCCHLVCNEISHNDTEGNSDCVTVSVDAVCLCNNNNEIKNADNKDCLNDDSNNNNNNSNVCCHLVSNALSHNRTECNSSDFVSVKINNVDLCCNNNNENKNNNNQEKIVDETNMICNEIEDNNPYDDEEHDHSICSINSSNDTINSTTTTPTTPTTTRKHSKISCSICLSTIQNNSIVMTGTQCMNHIFHYDCYTEWITKHDVCPYCRNEIMTSDEMNIASELILGKDRINELHRINFCFSSIP